MTWCALYEEGLPPNAEAALLDLNARVQAALTKVGHNTGFHFGRIPGTPIENLYSAVGVELSFSGAWLSGRPRLERIENSRLRYNAPPTRAAGRSHREYQLASDLLRALASQALRPLIHDDEKLNRACRNFADGWLFGHPVHFAKKLEEYGSIFGIHAVWDIPNSALAAYTAKLSHSDASVDTLYLIRGKGEKNSAAFHRHRLGVRPSTQDRLITAQQLFLEGAPEFGGRSMQYARVEANGSALLVNASAGRTLPMTTEGIEPFFNQADVVRLIFTSIRRLPSSIRGPLH